VAREQAVVLGHQAPRTRPAQFHARTTGVKPARAGAEDLEPTAMDRQRAAEAAVEAARPRQEFFGAARQVRRQVGGRISH
jgi:hypothetical protein